MVLTKEQALIVSEVWFRVDNQRNKAYGEVRKARRNGQTKVWVKSPARFSLPVKYGLYECFRVTEENAHQFFATREECEASDNPAAPRFAIVGGRIVDGKGVAK